MGTYRFEGMVRVEVEAESEDEARAKLGALPAMRPMSTQTREPVAEAHIDDDSFELIETPDGLV